MGSVSSSDSIDSAPDTFTLFETLETDFKASSLGVERWYLMAITALSGGPRPQMASDVYKYLIHQPQYRSQHARQALVRRLREALVKSIAVFGVCKPIESIIAISQLERDEDKDYTCSRENWKCDKENHERGVGWMRTIYKQNMESVLDLFSAHKDFAWITTNISYGLYLSDRQVLDDIDCQIVVLTGIMIQNLKLETYWHVRGARRLGFSKDDLIKLWNGVQTIGRASGLALDRVSTIDDVQDI
jgi:hypothetical protein